MIRHCFWIGFAALCLSACSPNDSRASPAASEGDQPSWDQALAERGLAAAAETLRSSEPSADTAFLLGGVQFLQAVEHILQVRYAHFGGAIPMIPGMRNDLPYNPDSRFDPAFLEMSATGALEHLARADAALAPALEGTFETDVPLHVIWFDINKNGAREDWESLDALMRDLGAAPDAAFEGVIRFDTADAEWLAAYVHVMSGTSEFVLSLDPTPAINQIYEGRARLLELGVPPSRGFLNDEFIDMAALTLLTLRGQPDPVRTRAAHAHFKAMIAHNQAFWAELGLETDNHLEWLPNPNQTSAYGLEVPVEMAEGWQDVLAEIDAILDGEKLVPYFRLDGRQITNEDGQGLGLNLKTFFDEPGDLDPVLWIQGAAAAPYLEYGVLADGAAWRRFQDLTRGNGLVFAVLLN